MKLLRNEPTVTVREARESKFAKNLTRKSFKNGCQQIRIYICNQDFPQDFYIFDFCQISCEAIKMSVTQ